MKRICEAFTSVVIAGILYLGCLVSAEAQNTQCANRSAGDSTNACANTRFVTSAISTAQALAQYHFFIGNASGVATDTALSGDCTYGASGIICLKTNNVSFGYFATGTDAANLSGTLALARLGAQTANTVLAGPTSGGAATPTFRALTAADIPGFAVQSFSTRAAAIAATISANTANITLGGYTSAGDGGQGALYIRYAGACTPAWTFASADGQCWILNNVDATPYQFGAVGNGVTNDSTAVQDWLNFCGTINLRCRLAKGTYNVSSTALTVSSGSTIVGDGASSILLRTASAATAVLTATSNVKTVLSNFTVQATPAATTVTISNASPGVVTGLALPATSAVWLSTTGTLPNPLTTTTPYYVVSPSGNTFSLSLTMGGAAINTTTAGSGTHSLTSSSTAWGVRLISSTNSTVDNVKILGALYYGVEDKDGTGNRVTNNSIYGMVNRGIYISSTTNGYGSVTANNYINGSDNYTATVQFTTYCININDFGTGHNNGFLLDGNYIINCLGNGITTGGLSYGVISNNNITNSGAAAASGSGIVVEAANGNSDTDVVIANNKVDGAYRGILVNDSDYVVVSGNLVKSSLLNGIDIYGSNNTSVTGNIVRTSANVGINVDLTSSYTSASANQVVGNTVYGMYSAATTSNGLYVANSTSSNGTNASFNGTGDSTGSGGSGTPGGANTQVQYNNAGAFGGSANLTWVSPALTVGVAGSTTGQVKLTGSTSGTITMQGQAAAGTYNWNLPTGAGSSGQVLQSGGGTTNPMAWSTATFPATATGTGTILRADGTNWVATTATYPTTTAAGTVLGSSSANVVAATATPTLGANGGTGGQITFNGSTSGSSAVKVAAAAGSSTFQLPVGNGTSGQFLSTDGAGVTSWATASGTGDVVGPASATDNAAARFDLTTGKLIQNSALIIADTTGSLSRSGNGGIPVQGTNTNDDAAAGYIGEYLYSATTNATATVTISNASPGVVSWTGHGLNIASGVYFTTTGALPTGLTVSTNYYVCSTGFGANAFSVATTVANAIAGTCINTSSAGSGTHTAFSQTLLAVSETDYDVTGIQLTAGDWDIWATARYSGAASTTLTRNVSSISLTSATVNATQAFISANFYNGATVFNTTSVDLLIGPVRVSINTPTTYFLTSRALFGVSTAYGLGKMQARRVR